MKRISKRVCLVTGASAGIGRETARLLSERGQIVYGTSRNIPQGEVREDGGVRMIALDTTDALSVERAVALLLAREGRIDLLINNAGTGVAGPLEETTEAAAKAQMDVNFFGPLRLCRAVLPAMRQAGGGRIVNIGSVAAHVPIPFQTLYSASKSALSALTEGLAMETKPFGIACATIDPGDTKTEFTARREKTAQSGVYAARCGASLARMERDEQNGASPAKVARVIVRSALARRMPARRTVGSSYGLVVALSRVLPVRWKRFLIGTLYG